MRKLMFGFAAALLVAGTLVVTATPASAGITKNCWSHTDTDQFLADGVTPNPTFGQLVPVWANGGGHDKHQADGLDTLLGTTETADACKTLFTGGV